MTDWHDPAVILAEYCASSFFTREGSFWRDLPLRASVAYVDIIHVLFGVYM
jgi:hypothetical protein